MTEAAFREAAYSNGSEAAITARLRDTGALACSLVAEASGAIVGHVAFSPAAISNGAQGWFGLGPVSVLPARQGEGIGSALIREGLARLRDRGGRGCVVLGAPDYCRRFGYGHDPALALAGPPPEFFMRLVMAGPEPAGEVYYAPAFA